MANIYLNMIKRLPALAVLSTASLLGFASTARASSQASDNASDPAYADGWATGDNGGTGFLAWTLASTPTGATATAGQFIGSSTDLAGDATGINSAGGVAFGMYASASVAGGDSAYSDAFRSFAGGALAAGQTFALDIAVNFRNGFKGLDLRSGTTTASATTLFNFNIGGDDYTANGTSIGNAYSDNTTFHLSFTQTDTTGGTYTITRGGGIAQTATGTYTGDADGFHLYVGNTDTGGNAANNFYANNMTITGAAVPEPGAWAWIVAGGAGALGLMRRRVAAV